ncbi:cytochrome P450 [Collybia nuda]|uniref:Cytochrome P450 n=1 Tax=Collybia nuda TaxID=64659 RepID=A0A9P6CEX0_9AGAR|nr:cytochrome P450 [Collybia nuda]
MFVLPHYIPYVTGIMTIISISKLLLTFLSLLLLRTLVQRWRQPAALPPGPKGLPLIGNILDMPTEKEWLTFARWGEKWGDITSVNVFGQTLIILNSAKVATEMLEKKSSIYSDRPTLQMGGELVGWKNALVFIPYGDRFRRFRRYIHQAMGNNGAVSQYLPLEEIEAHRFLRRVLDEPEDLSLHIRKMSGAIILRITHGYETRWNDDPLVELADKVLEQFSLATVPGAFMVDLIPALCHVPSWFPGAGFQKLAASWSAGLSGMVERPYTFVKRQMSDGIAPISFASTLLETESLSNEEELDIKWSALSLYAGGFDTTVSTIYALFLAMTLYPDVLKKAQAEIDAMVGNDRLPTFSDRDELPYVNALVKEVHRWNVVVPSSIPHRVTQDDVHAGYFIPKGSLVITNIWKMTRNPAVYPDPERFDPSRFISSEGGIVQPDPLEVCFGFGRRICPGILLADASLFISCATSLAVFDISKCVVDGVVVEPKHENTSGTLSHPKPFKCSIKPRSHKAASLIKIDENY